MPVERVLLATPRSFCAGVEMAIKALAWMLRIHDRPVYCYHEIVHNQVVVDRFRQAGVVFVDDLAEVPDGAPLMLSAHGSAPEVVGQARAGARIVVDAVCPLVKKVHHELQRRARHGHVVYAGHARHDEAVGTVAVAPDRVRLVEHPEDVNRIEGVEGPVSFLAQTTLALDDWQAFLDATRERFGDVWVPGRSDLCFATTNRQAAVKAVAPRCDAVVVIGSTTSSNTLSLVKVAETVSDARVLRVNGPDELPPDLAGVVGVTAGASAPDDLVHAVVDTLAPFDGTEVIDVTLEDEYFPPPRELRELLRARGEENLLDHDRIVAATDVLRDLPTVPFCDLNVVLKPRIQVTEQSHSTMLGRWSEEIDAEMAAVIDAEVDAPWLRSAIGYHLGWLDEDFQPLGPGVPRAGGKKLRGHLAVLAQRAATTTAEQLALGTVAAHDDANGGVHDPNLARVLPFAAAVELLHNWSLVHDDIQDGDRTRRGRPAVWTLCGEAQAINVGNCLYALAFRSLLRLGERGVPADVIAELTAGLAGTAVEVTVGQMQDLTFETTLDVDADGYVDMIRGKTAGLLGYSTGGGARLAPGGDDPEVQQHTAARFGAFGRALGLAFQVRDDVLGIWGDDTETGKPVDGDILRRKKTLPVVLALATAPLPYRQRLHQLYGRRTPLTLGEAIEVRQILDRCGAQPRAQHWAERQRAAALATLHSHPRPRPLTSADAVDALAHLADFVTHRTH